MLFSLSVNSVLVVQYRNVSDKIDIYKFIFIGKLFAFLYNVTQITEFNWASAKGMTEVRGKIESCHMICTVHQKSSSSQTTHLIIRPQQGNLQNLLYHFLLLLNKLISPDNRNGGSVLAQCYVSSTSLLGRRSFRLIQLISQTNVTFRINKILNDIIWF